MNVYSIRFSRIIFHLLPISRKELLDNKKSFHMNTNMSNIKTTFNSYHRKQMINCLKIHVQNKNFCYKKLQTTINSKNEKIFHLFFHKSQHKSL